MNCKPGDLAILTKSMIGNEGKIVKIIRGLGEDPYYEDYVWCIGRGFCWLVEFQRPSPDLFGDLHQCMPAPDAWLRPLPGILELEDTTTDTPIKELA